MQFGTAAQVAQANIFFVSQLWQSRLVPLSRGSTRNGQFLAAGLKSLGSQVDDHPSPSYFWKRHTGSISLQQTS